MIAEKLDVKKDKSVKIALDARALNQSIAKNNYQMSNLDNSIDMIAEKLDDLKLSIFPFPL